VQPTAMARKNPAVVRAGGFLMRLRKAFFSKMGFLHENRGYLRKDHKAGYPSDIHFTAGEKIPSPADTFITGKKENTGMRWGSFPALPDQFPPPPAGLFHPVFRRTAGATRR